MASKEDRQRGVEYAREIRQHGEEYSKDFKDKANETRSSVRQLKENSAISFNPNKAIFTTIAMIFLVRSVDLQNRDIFLWIFNYTRNWTLFSLPYLAFRVAL